MSDRDDIIPPGDIAPGDTGPEHHAFSEDLLVYSVGLLLAAG